jgi:anthranilate synthase component 1
MAGFFVPGATGRASKETAMVTPALPDFLDLAREGRIAPLRRRIPADLETPVSAYLQLAPLGAVCLLESVEQGIQVGRYSFIGLAPRCEVVVGDDTVTVVRGEHRRTRPLDAAAPFAAIEAELERARDLVTGDLPGPLGAAVAYLGWETVRHFERVPLPAAGHDGLPDARFVFPSQLVVFDHVKSEIEVAVLPPVGGG